MGQLLHEMLKRKPARRSHAVRDGGMGMALALENLV